MHDWIDIILVYEENWSWGDLVILFSYVWWGVMQLWMWYAYLSQLAFKQITLRPKSSNKLYPLKYHQDSSEYWSFLNYGQYWPEKCQMFYLQ